MAVFPLPPLSGAGCATLTKTVFNYVSDCIESLNWMQGCGFRPEAFSGRGSAAKEANLHAESHEMLLQAWQRWACAGESPSQQEAWN